MAKIISINGNMITVQFTENLMQNEVGYIIYDKLRLKAEVIKINHDIAYLQVFESTKGIKAGDQVEFTNKLLSINLGPGLLGNIFDGLGNPLPQLADKYGFFLPRGKEEPSLSITKKWDFHPLLNDAEKVTGGSILGYVKENNIEHKIFVPFYLQDEYILTSIKKTGTYSINEKIAEIKNLQTNETFSLTMCFDWPIKQAITNYQEKCQPQNPLITGIRIIDSFFPIAKGGTYCIPGPFGAGKTVLQQLISKFADIDIVIISACGERAGEVVEGLKTFPELTDPKTNKPLMERTIIICNTSSMPVSAREASLYTSITLAEYYRQMGKDVLLLADSTSRWAQAMREISARLEEIPGDEAYPSYLESRIAQFYERAGMVKLNDNTFGSVTIGGTVSPAGGNFEEPVTEATLKVVGAFLGLSKDRANARRFPAIDPIESWSKYNSILKEEDLLFAKKILKTGKEISQMMKVVGEEGISSEDYQIYLKAELIDNIFLEQNAFDKIDSATTEERQITVFNKLKEFLQKDLTITDKKELRDYFHHIRYTFKNWNYQKWGSDEFQKTIEIINEEIKNKTIELKI